MSKKKSISSSSLIYGLLLIVLGILFIIGGVGTANNLMAIVVTVMGALFLVYGIFAIAKGNVLYGIIEIILGILMIVFAWTIAYVAFIVIGVLLFVMAIYDIIGKRGNMISNIISLILGLMVILLACGVNFAWNFVNIFFYVAGALMIVDGILVLLKK